MLSGAVSVVLGLWGGLLLVGAAGGSDDVWQPLKVYSGSRISGAPSAHEAFMTINDPAVLQSQLELKRQGPGPMGTGRLLRRLVRVVQDHGKTGVRQTPRNGRPGDVRPLRLDVTADNAASRALLGRQSARC